MNNPTDEQLSRAVAEKVCRDCKTAQPLINFDKRSAAKDGRSNQCKSCRSQYDKANCVRRRELRREYKREYQKERRKDPEYRKKLFFYTKRYSLKNPKERKVHNAIRTAVKNGKLFSAPCVICGNPKSQAHHDNYDRVFNIVWLCSIHHAERHRGLDKKYSAINETLPRAACLAILEE